MPLVGFELETNGFQFYAIANLDKTSLVIVLLNVWILGIVALKLECINIAVITAPREESCFQISNFNWFSQPVAV